MTLYCVWGDVAVPLFLLIQVFHAYKHGTEKCQFSFKKIWTRIFKWYIFAEIVIIVLHTGLDLYRGNPKGDIYEDALNNLGVGPGNYYAFIYIEFAIILYWIRNIINKVKPWHLLLAFLLISELSEIICSLIEMPQNIYRLLFLRYIFLIWLALMIVRKGILINKTNVLLSIVSIAFVLFFNYTNYDLEPFIFTTGWKTFHWMSYFYIANIYILGLYVSYKVLHRKTGTGFIEKMGKYSWEIFLVQMIYFTFPWKSNLDNIINQEIATCVFPVLSIFICAGTVLAYKKFIMTES